MHEFLRQFWPKQPVGMPDWFQISTFNDKKVAFKCRACLGGTTAKHKTEYSAELGRLNHQVYQHVGGRDHRNNMRKWICLQLSQQQRPLYSLTSASSSTPGTVVSTKTHLDSYYCKGYFEEFHTYYAVDRVTVSFEGRPPALLKDYHQTGQGWVTWVAVGNLSEPFFRAETLCPSSGIWSYEDARGQSGFRASVATFVCDHCARIPFIPAFRARLLRDYQALSSGRPTRAEGRPPDLCGGYPTTDEARQQLSEATERIQSLASSNRQYRRRGTMYDMVGNLSSMSQLRAVIGWLCSGVLKIDDFLLSPPGFFFSGCLRRPPLNQPEQLIAFGANPSG